MRKAIKNTDDSNEKELRELTEEYQTLIRMEELLKEEGKTNKKVSEKRERVLGKIKRLRKGGEK